MPAPSKIGVFYKTFRDISSLVHSSVDLKEVLELVVWKVSEALEAKGAILRILNLETGEFELSAAYGLSEAYLSKGPITQQHLITDVYRKESHVIIEDVLNDSRVHYPQEAQQEGIRMLLDLPLVFRDDIAGLMRVFSPNLIPQETHITLAWGRDYGDVTPVKGVVMGGGDHRLTVRVEVTAME